MSYSPPSSAKPFTLQISDQDLSEWRQLLQLSKLGPDTWESRQTDRRFGVTRQWMSDTKEHWLHKYDWREQEKHINSFPNYKMQIEMIELHFVALFSEKKDAIPIILMHGWPGSFTEFLPICKLIRDQYSPAEQQYHIIVPSLPGYTLSSGGPLDSDWTMQDSARILNQLMLNLGFEKYIAQGGDVGSFEARILSQSYDSCVGIHLNMMSSAEVPDKDTLSTLEARAVDRSAEWRATGMAYGMEHGTRPSTIGHVLSSNPLALLAWIGEKFLEWTEEDPELDFILTDVMLYWFTQGFPRSLYPYRRIMGSSRTMFEYLKKPTGFSFFPFELMPGIKTQLEKNCNLVFYRQHEHGGHFAALERPNELWADVEEFIRTEGVWKGASSEPSSRL